MKIIYPLLFFTLFLSACDLMEFSPNQAFDHNSPQDLNRKNIAQLLRNPTDDTIRFVLTGDSQRAYKNSQDFVNTVNNIHGVDFVLLAGDISDFGLLGEMEWINEIFSQLKSPYIGVIGNHDLVANGETIYKRMFGPLDFSFVYQRVKFICHNTNSREANFDGSVPNINWLKNEFAASTDVDAYIPVAHIAPFSTDFDKSLESEYAGIVNSSPNTLAALYAHDHSEKISYPYTERIPYIITNSLIFRQFLLIEIVKGKLKYESIKY